MFKLGDYVTPNDNTGYSSMRNLNGVVFKVIGIEDDNDRAIITVCDKTVIKADQKSSFNSNFSYTTFSFGMLNSSFDYLGDEFEDFDDEDDWYDGTDEDDDYNDDYYPETVEQSAIINICNLQLIKAKKGNTNLFR